MFCIVFGWGLATSYFDTSNKKTPKSAKMSRNFLPSPLCLEWKQCAHHGPSTRELSLRMLAYGPDSRPRVAITREESCFVTPPLTKRNCSQKACRCFRDFEKKKKSAHRNSFFAVFEFFGRGNSSKASMRRFEKFSRVFEGCTSGKFTSKPDDGPANSTSHV